MRGNPERMDALNDLAVAYHLEGHSEAARQLLDEVGIHRQTMIDEAMRIATQGED